MKHYETIYRISLKILVGCLKRHPHRHTHTQNIYIYAHIKCLYLYVCLCNSVHLSSNLSRFETTTILIQHESRVQITPTPRNPEDNFCPPAKLSQSAQGSCRPTGALMPPVPAVATSCRFNDFIAAIPTIYPQSLKILMATLNIEFV